VASSPSGDLFIYAKDLLVEARSSLAYIEARLQTMRESFGWLAHEA